MSQDTKARLSFGRDADHPGLLAGRELRHAGPVAQPVDLDRIREPERDDAQAVGDGDAAG